MFDKLMDSSMSQLDGDAAGDKCVGVGLQIRAGLQIRWFGVVGLGLTLLVCSLVSDANAFAVQEIDFNRDIRPILSDKCYACHGPDSGQRQGGGEDGLRFDNPAGAFEDLGGYQAIVPGDLAKSMLLQRINSSDPDEVMPPADHRKSLTDSEKQKLSQWIAEGAVWAEHWSYRKLVRSALPGSSDVENHPNFIDAFVAAGLHAKELHPSPQADKATLIRRLNFDLLGLPPRPEEVTAFINDASPDAYQRVVERLLNSPQFGERMAVYWLDLVRYADTVGYHGDQDVSVSPFRDYVIEAFNQNMPFDQFTREQLAGDLLPNPTTSQLVASGYNRLGMMSAEGGVQPKEYLLKYAADRVRNASTVWLGSTLGCAECHDHKFDPFHAKDFYQFAAFFADMEERGLYSGANSDGNWGPFVTVTDPKLPSLLEPIDREIQNSQQVLDESTVELQQNQLLWENDVLAKRIVWSVLELEKAEAQHGTQLDLQAGGSLLASGPLADKDTYSLVFKPNDLESLTALQVQLLVDPSLPKNGPGRAGNGNLVLTELQAFLVTGEREAPIALQNASATFQQVDGSADNPYKAYSAAATIDQDKQGSLWGWAILPQAGQTQSLVVETTVPIDLKDSRLKIVLQQNHGTNHTMGHFQIRATSAIPPVKADSNQLAAEIWAALDTKPDLRSQEQKQSLATYYRSIAPSLQSTRERLLALNADREGTISQNTRSSLIAKQVKPRETRILKRGNWMDETGEVVDPAVPHFMQAIDKQGRADRLDLANWMTSNQNPLTARVFVNRLWKLYFGTGLSKVLDDLGSQGEWPTHPRLLDNLAVEFMESGWDIKHMVRLIVISSTYRQSSLPNATLDVSDPYNRMLARQARFRLDAEMIRDNALAVSGLLVNQVGGRSVKPYQPLGLYQHLNFPRRTYTADMGQDQYRRGLYTHWQRQFLHPAMQTFDAPSREECTAERPRSNTPLAALVLLNDPTYVEAARSFAQQALLQTQLQTTEAKIAWMVETAFSRPANAKELTLLSNLLEDQKEFYAQNQEAAKALIKTGQSVPDEGLDAVELASWTFVARTLFNLHEFIVRN